jgi:putative membrane protein
MKAQLVQHGITFVRGMCMGVAEAIPGVSGSTIALVLGIYDRFIDVLYGVSQVVKEMTLLVLGKSSVQKVRESIEKIEWGFAIALAVGMFTSIILLAGLLGYWLEVHPQYVFAFFTGLILMSLSVPWNMIKKRTWKHVLVAFFTALFFWLVFAASPTTGLESPALWYVFVGGMIGISAMVLPGVSGSFILLVMGLYEPILGKVKSLSGFDTSVIVPLMVFGAGILVGFVLFVRVLKWVMARYHGWLMAFLTGILVASFRIMWPFFEMNGEEVAYVLPWTIESQELGFIVLFLAMGTGAVALLKTLTPKI